MIDSEAPSRPPIDLGRTTTVGSLLLVLVFLVKAYAVARYSLTTMTGLVVATPVQVALGTVSFYAYLVMPALALATGWLTVRRLAAADRASIMPGAWPVLAGITVVCALMSPVPYLETGIALLAVCLRLELRLRTFLQDRGPAGPASRWTRWRPHDRWSRIPAWWGLPRWPPAPWQVRLSSGALLVLALVGAGWSPQFRTAGLVLVAVGVLAEAPFSVWLRQIDRPGLRAALRRSIGRPGRVVPTSGAARRGLGEHLRGRTLAYLGGVAVLWYFLSTLETPWVPAQLYVLTSPVEVSTQDKSVANRVLDVERVRALIGFPLTKDGDKLTVLEAGTRRIVHMPAAAVRAEPLCHSDQDQLIGQRPLLWQLLGTDYDSHNITCETLRELFVPPRGLAFDPSGTVLAGAGWDGALGLWNPVTGRPLGSLTAAEVKERVAAAPESGQAPYPVAFDPRGSLLAAADPDGTVSLRETTTYRVRLTLPPHPDLAGRPSPVSALTFTPDGKALVAAADDVVTIWDLTTNATSPASTVLRPSPGNAINALAVTGRGARAVLAAGGDDDLIRLWNVGNRGEPVPLTAPFPAHPAVMGGDAPRNAIYALAFSPDGTTLAAAGGRRDMSRGMFPTVYTADAAVRLWNLDDPAKPGPLGPPLTGHSGAVNALGFSPDGAVLASGSSDTTIRLWDVSSPSLPHGLGQPLTGHTGAVDTIAFRPVTAGGVTVLATTGTDQTVRLWEIPAARTRAVLTPP